MKEMLDLQAIPRHIAIIMDGNGRWAKERGKNRLFGHVRGVESVRDIVRAASDIGLKYLTIYAFSTENWQRPETEVRSLFKLILKSLLKEINALALNNVRVRFIGSRQGIKDDYYREIEAACQKTEKAEGLNFTIAFNYGGRQEIVEAINKILESTLPITQENVARFLYTAGMPDPDLLIRTSGEMRLSNFLLWQSAYSELWFTKTLWPDFRREEFFAAIYDYQKRQRRYGGI